MCWLKKPEVGVIIARIDLSLSDDGGFALAFVVLSAS